MKRFLANTALMVASLVVALLVGEAGLRLTGYQPGNPLERLINHPDPWLGYRMLPGMRETVPGPGSAYIAETIDLGFEDAAGFRDDGIEGPVGSVFIGDSFVWGFGVELAESISERYEALSGEDAVNLGMTSWTSPTQYARVLAKYGVTLSPRFAFMEALIENDFGDGPNFADWLDSGTAKSYPEWMTDRVMNYEPDTWSYRIRRLLYDRSALARLASDRIQFGLGNPEPANPGLVHATGGGLDLYLDPDEIALAPPARREIEIFRAALVEGRAIAGRNRIQLVVFIVPTKEMVYQDRFPDPALQAAVDTRYATLKSLLEETGVAYVDLLPPLRTAAAGGQQQLYFARDTHWTAAGHQVAAEALRRWVVTHCPRDECTS